MNFEQIIEKIKSMEEDRFFRDRIAQLNARYILFNTDENPEAFPNYSVQDDRLTMLAYQYLSLGCRLVENEHLQESTIPLEKGAQVLEYIYGSANNDISFRKYHVLIASLAYYCGFQYSKSFLLINKVESETTISRLVYLFLSRQFSNLQDYISEILLNNNQNKINGDEDEQNGSDRIYEVVIARNLGKIIAYLNFGDEELLKDAKGELQTLKEIAEIRGDGDLWWVIRLIIIIIFGIEKSSLWSVLKNHYGSIPTLARRFIYSHVFSRYTKIHEFFTTQRQAIHKIIGKESGVIISMPTSSGKTRIAEVAILDTKIQHEESKILFIAPYRSLAFELENDLEKVFSPIGVNVSQLYGGSLFNRLDEQVVVESDVIIATQEKAKALFRSDSEILKTIKLIVLDEGHLLGANERLIRNEMFMEELRYYMDQSGGRFVVLSAVLPNPEDLAHWLTKSSENVFASDWRPSEERIGILEWTGRNVNLKWRSADDERDSFNNKFVVAEELPLTGRQTVVKYLPGNKNEAVAATAIKLFSFGTVLIFVGLKASVLTMAKAYAKVLGHVDDFPWKNPNNWRAFVLACIEYDSPNSDWLRYAKKGILCHNASLPADVRIPLERIMRTEKPRVIIATSTLGQGVNLGVSSVIFSTIYQAGEPIGHGDFWNIAGRAGRAFVDQEGKILVAHDVSDNRTLKKRRRNRWKQQQIEGYFEKTNIQSVESGLLWLIKTLNYIAHRFNKLNFDTFIQLVAENQLEDLKESDFVVEGFDLIDDTLLALHQQFNEADDVYDVTWVESFFKQSLAFIQLEQRTDEDLSDDEMVSFVKARIHGIIASVGTDRSKWNAHITSGIPLQSDLILEAHLGDIISEIEAYFEETDKLLDDKIKLLKSIEAIINQVPVLKMDYLESVHLNTIRELWISGSPMTEIKNLPDSSAIVQEHYSFKLPWVLNGIAKKLSVLELEKECELLQEIALLSETGLPNLVAVKIYQAGIRSRTASTELSAFFDLDAWDKGIKFYKNVIRKNALELKEEVSNETVQWLDLLLSYSVDDSKTINHIPPFAIPDIEISDGTILIPKTINGSPYLVSLDQSLLIPTNTIEDVVFDEVMDEEGVYFYLDTNGEFNLNIINPRLILE